MHFQNKIKNLEHRKRRREKKKKKKTFKIRFITCMIFQYFPIRWFFTSSIFMIATSFHTHTYTNTKKKRKQPTTNEVFRIEIFCLFASFSFFLLNLFFYIHFNACSTNQFQSNFIFCSNFIIIIRSNHSHTSSNISIVFLKKKNFFWFFLQFQIFI